MLSQPSFSPPLINEDLPAGPQLVFTLNNRFFRHQACYSLLPAKTGGQADRVISLCKYKVVADYNSVGSAAACRLQVHKVQKVHTVHKSEKNSRESGLLYKSLLQITTPSCPVLYSSSILFALHCTNS
jgi:hypothetical protein